MPSSSERECKTADQPAVLPLQATAAFDSKQVETVSLKPKTPQAGPVVLDQLQPGQMLGQYRIVQHLGAGGMGQVYKAIHPAMDRVVALKIIMPRIMQDASARARFQREVRNAARLLHPNVVVAYDAAEVSGLWFLVMEFIDGKDLSSLLSKYGRPPLGLACEIIRQAAAGLQHAHELGMVHRDIKPANLIVTSARTLPAGAMGADGWPTPPLVKILDFGLARLATPDSEVPAGDGVTREGCVVGTPEYMAPEQAQDTRVVDIRSDIYSLGCTMYALLAGRPPFRAASSFEMIVMHLREPAEPVVRYCPDVPEELSAVVHRMLAKRPEDRFQTPGEVAAALQPWARFAAAPTPQHGVIGPSQHVNLDFLAPASVSGSSAPQPQIAPPPRTAPPPPRPEPTIPREVMAMHFQAVLRTIMLMLIIIFVIVGCAMYLPDIGDYVLNLWHKVTPHTTRTVAPPR